METATTRVNTSQSKASAIMALRIFAALLSLAGMTAGVYMIVVLAPKMGWMAGLAVFPALIAMPFMVVLLGGSMRLLSARVIRWYAFISLVPSIALLSTHFPLIGAVITAVLFSLDISQREYERVQGRTFPYQRLIVILSLALPIIAGFLVPQIAPYYHSTPGG